MSLTLSDLVTVKGLKNLIAATGGNESAYNDPHVAKNLVATVTSATDRHPQLSNLPINLAPKLHNSFYDVNTRSVTLGISDPATIAHEVEHANNITAGSAYAKLLNITKSLSTLNKTVSIPATLALRTFLKNKDTRDDVLKTLSGISAALAAPELVEEAVATARAIKNNPGQRADFAKRLLPALMAHFASGVAPSLVYQLGRTQ